MPNPIILPLPAPQPAVEVTEEQVTALITAIASAEPAVITLPEGKAFTDVKSFNLLRTADGAGRLVIRFR